MRLLIGLLPFLAIGAPVHTEAQAVDSVAVLIAAGTALRNHALAERAVVLAPFTPQYPSYDPSEMGRQRYIALTTFFAQAMNRPLVVRPPILPASVAGESRTSRNEEWRALRESLRPFARALSIYEVDIAGDSALVAVRATSVSTEDDPRLAFEEWHVRLVRSPAGEWAVTRTWLESITG